MKHTLSWRYPWFDMPWFGFRLRITKGDHANRTGPIKWWIVNWLIFGFTIIRQDKWEQK